MPCCTNEQSQSFVNVLTTVMPISLLRPYVEVIYYNGTSWYPSGIETQVKIIPGTSITVDHGGLATGIIKVSGETVL